MREAVNGNCVILIEIENNFTMTIPSCNDCAATIVTTQIPRTRKGVGTACPALLKEIKTFIPRNPESGGVSRGELKLYFNTFSFLEMFI